MIGLLLKDCYSLKSYLRQLSFSLLIFIGFGIYSKNPVYMVSMVLFLTSMLVLTTMGYDEASKWNIYAISLPIGRKTIVASKYLFMIGSIVAGLIPSVIIGLLISYVNQFSLTEMLAGTIGVACVILIIYSILLPIIFKYGPERGRTYMILVFLIPTFVIVLLGKFISKYNISLPSLEAGKSILFFLPVLLIIFLFISYKISCKIISKKEF